MPLDCTHSSTLLLMLLLRVRATATGAEALQLLHLSDHLEALQRDEFLDFLFAVGLVSQPTCWATVGQGQQSCGCWPATPARVQMVHPAKKHVQ